MAVRGLKAGDVAGPQREYDYEPQNGDVVVDQTGHLYSRRGEDWADGGYPPHVAWIGNGEDDDHLISLKGEPLEPVVLLLRYVKHGPDVVIENCTYAGYLDVEVAGKPVHLVGDDYS